MPQVDVVIEEKNVVDDWILKSMEWLRSKLECDLGKKQILASTFKRGKLADSLVKGPALETGE